MLKIYALDYYRLDKASHSALMDFMAEAIKSYPVVAETFPKAVELFLAALKDEHHVFHHVDRPLQSAKVQSADMERVRYFRMFRDLAKLKLWEDDQAIKEAARIIVEVSDSFGGSGIGSQSVDSRTGNLHVFIQRLENDYYDDVATLGLQPYLELLREANLHFLESQSERLHSDAEYGLNATKRARRSCDFTLKTLFSLIQDKIRLGEGEEFEDFVKFINVEIDKNRIALGQGPGGSPRRRKNREEF